MTWSVTEGDGIKREEWHYPCLCFTHSIKHPFLNHLGFCFSSLRGKQTNNSLFIQDNQLMSRTRIIYMTSHLWPPDARAGNTPARAESPGRVGNTPTSGGRWREQLCENGWRCCAPQSSPPLHLRAPPPPSKPRWRWHWGLLVLEQVRCLSGPLYCQIPQRLDLMHSQRSDIAAGSRRPLPSTTNKRPY